MYFDDLAVDYSMERTNITTTETHVASSATSIRRI